jgi:hypothetical protein
MAKKTKNKLIKSVHLKAVLFLLLFLIASNLIFIKAISHPSIYVSFLVPLIFGTLSGSVFLYLFSHKKIFHFATNLETEERKNEKKYLAKFKHFGKLATCIFISALGGPILLALTVKFLFATSENKYLILAVSTMVSTIFGVLLARGFFSVALSFLQ